VPEHDIGSALEDFGLSPWMDGSAELATSDEFASLPPGGSSNSHSDFAPEHDIGSALEDCCPGPWMDGSAEVAVSDEFASLPPCARNNSQHLSIWSCDCVAW